MIGNMKQFFYVLPVKKREGKITTKNKWRSKSYPLLEELYLLGFCLLALSSSLSLLCYILTTYSLILAGRVNLLLWVPQVIALCPSSKEGLRQTPRSCIGHFPVTKFPIIGKLCVVLFDMLGGPSTLRNPFQRQALDLPESYWLLSKDSPDQCICNFLYLFQCRHEMALSLQ